MEEDQDEPRPSEEARNGSQQKSGLGIGWGAAVFAVAAAGAAAWMSRKRQEETPMAAEEGQEGKEGKEGRRVSGIRQQKEERAQEEERAGAGAGAGEEEMMEAEEEEQGGEAKDGEEKEAEEEWGGEDGDEEDDREEMEDGEGMVVSKEGGAQHPNVSLIARVASFASSAAFTVSEKSSQLFKHTYAIAITRRFEGEEGPRRGGAAQALAAGRGNLSSFNPGPNFNLNILKEESLSIAELKVDAICSRLVHDVYEDDHTRWPLGGFEIKANSPLEGWRLTPKWVVLTHKAMNIAAVTFRGTFSVTDAVADLVCIPILLPCGLKVHAGMAEMMMKCEGEIREALTEAIQGMTQPRLIFTGHSYGGGCAKLLRLHAIVDPAWHVITQRVASIEVVTFGAPLVFGPGPTLRGQQGKGTPDLPGGAAAEPPGRSSGMGGGGGGGGGGGAGMECVSALTELQRSCRCYVHQGDIVPRLLGPKSADLYDRLVTVSLQETQRQMIRKCVAAYGPIGSYRFIYTSAASNTHHIRVAADAAEAQHLLEPLKAIFTLMAVQDHGTLLYSDKVEAVLSALLTPRS